MTDAADKNFTPYDSEEFIEQSSWERRSSAGALDTVRSIAAWSDICGIGNALEKAGWNLDELSKQGSFGALNVAYKYLGNPFIIGVPPSPTERVLVINDGIARTVDLIDARFVVVPQLLFYVRDLLMHHFMLERQLVGMKLGLRTVLAGGERCQYSLQKKTGESFLFYTNQPSDFGKALLDQQFVYNPSEFQMNTAFALAYSLEAMGKKEGFISNRLYIEQRWIDALTDFLPSFVRVENCFIIFMHGGQPAITVNTDRCWTVNVRGLVTRVYRVMEFTVHREFEGETTHFPMAEHDLPLGGN